MSGATAAVPGSLVAWWRGSDLAVAVVAAEEKQRVTLVGPGGREDRVPPARLAFVLEPFGPVPGRLPGDRRPAAERAADAEARIRAAAAALDVPVLWELLLHSSSPLSEEGLAEIAAGARTASARAATVRALLDDGVRFVRKADGWEPRSEEAVREILLQREREAQRAGERERARAALRGAAAGGGWHPTGAAIESRWLDVLEAVAIGGDEVDPGTLDAAREILSEAGARYDRVHEGAFRLLRATGRFDSDDANLLVARYRLRTEFPPEVLAAADAARARGFERAGRTDLTALDVLTVDDPRTLEIDDGLSAEPLGGGALRVGIHIADPSAFLAPGDAVDVEAASRGTSFYFPDLRLPMIPPAISEDAASLTAGEVRPALSFFAVLDGDGNLQRCEAVRSVIRVRERLDYDRVDAILAGSEASPWRGLLETLAGASTRREAARSAAGAVGFRGDEVEIRVGADGLPVLERRDTGSSSHKMVSECMVLAGAVVARLCAERGVVAIHRRQSAGAGAAAFAGATGDPVAARQLRKLLKRAEPSLAPGPHAALGLPAYVQATSPLRRFQDLANHRQILAAIGAGTPAYDVEALQRIAGFTDRAEGDGRRAERAADRYWILRWIEARRDEILEGIVVESDPRPVVLLDATLLEETVPAVSGTAPGTRVRLRVERVNPRADLLALRPV